MKNLKKINKQFKYLEVREVDEETFKKVNDEYVFYKTGKKVYQIFYTDNHFHKPGDCEDALKDLHDVIRLAEYYDIFWGQRIKYDDDIEKLKLSDEVKDTFDDVRYMLAGEANLEEENILEVQKALNILSKYIIKDSLNKYPL